MQKPSAASTSLKVRVKRQTGFARTIRNSVVICGDLGDGTNHISANKVTIGKADGKLQLRLLHSDTNDEGGRRQTMAALEVITNAMINLVFKEIVANTVARAVAVSAIKRLVVSWNYRLQSAAKHNLIEVVRNRAQNESAVPTIGLNGLFSPNQSFYLHLLQQLNQIRRTAVSNASELSTRDFALSLEVAGNAIRMATLPAVQSMFNETLAKVRLLERTANLRHNGIVACFYGNGVKSLGVREWIADLHRLGVQVLEIPVTDVGLVVGTGAAFWPAIRAGVDPRGSWRIGILVEREGTTPEVFRELTPALDADGKYALPAQLNTIEGLKTNDVRLRDEEDDPMGTHKFVMDMEVVVVKGDGILDDHPLPEGAVSAIQRIVVGTTTHKNGQDMSVTGSISPDGAINIVARVGRVQQIIAASLIDATIGSVLEHDPDNPPEGPVVDPPAPAPPSDNDDRAVDAM